MSKQMICPRCGYSWMTQSQKPQVYCCRCNKRIPIKENRQLQLEALTHAK